MDISTLKKQLREGTLSDQELESLLDIKPQQKHHKSSFGNMLLKGLKEGYTEPLLFKASLEFILLLTLIIGLIVLIYGGILPAVAGSTMLAFITGFILGKIR